MREYIKKIIHQIVDKWIVLVVMAVCGGAGTAAYDYFKRFFSLPEKVEEIHEQRKQDSIRASQYVIRIDSMGKTIKNHEAWIEEDYLLIQKIKNKLKIK